MKFSRGKPEPLFKLMTSVTIVSQKSISFFASKGGIFMLTSMAFIFLAGLAMAAICQKLKLPRIIGMLITGIILGPYVLNLLDPSILSISADLRQMALIIILLKAGLSLDLTDLKKVGRPAIMMSCVPASFEILAFFLFAPAFLRVTRIEAAVMGAVLGAVSPAVVVPRMVQLMDAGYGTDKSIPQLILAGAGFLLSLFFETAYAHRHCVRNSMKVIVVLGVSFLLMAIETWLKGIVSVSGLLAVVSMACVIKIKSVAFVSKRLSEKFGKLWLAAEVMLFVLVGAAVDIRYTMAAGAAAVLMILTALVFRSIGVALCLLGTSLTWKERLFCMIAYLPKATVQAAIGSVPLAMGLPCGQIVLSVAVLAILITAPMGAIGMDLTCRRFLKKAGKV